MYVFFHGGGWCQGGLDERDPRCRTIAIGAACLVASVDYRMAPENQFPTAPEDSFAAVGELVAHSDQLEHYLPDASMATDPRCSPLLAEDLSHLPPAWIMSAEYDRLRGDATAFADAQVSRFDTYAWPATSIRRSPSPGSCRPL